MKNVLLVFIRRNFSKHIFTVTKFGHGNPICKQVVIWELSAKP